MLLITTGRIHTRSFTSSLVDLEYSSFADAEKMWADGSAIIAFSLLRFLSKLRMLVDYGARYTGHFHKKKSTMHHSSKGGKTNFFSIFREI